MNQKIAHIAVVVPDYEAAIQYYTNVLGFLLLENTDLGEGKRWVLVKPQGADDFSLLLAKASSDEQKSRIGNQTGGRVFLFLYTDDFWRDHQSFTSRGVHFLESPRIENYGTVAVFVDLFGNKWDLIGPNKK